GQGKVEEILSSKAEERRAVFEEAAGVLKYKQRKREAEFKLIETEDNLDRVEDISHEIEKQIDPREKQAEIANLYLSKKAQLKQVEVSLIITEVNEKHQLWKKNLNKEKKLKDDEVKKNKYNKTIEAKLAKDKEISSQNDKKLQEIQTALLKATEELENAEGKRNLQNERNKHLSEKKAMLETEFNEKKQAEERDHKT